MANQGDTGLFGRFFPSHFAVSGMLVPACSGGNTSYFDQPFTLAYNVTAMSFPNPQLVDSATMTRYSAGAVSVALYDGTGNIDLSGSVRDVATHSHRIDEGIWLNGVFTPGFMVGGVFTSDTNKVYSGATGAPYNRTLAAPVSSGYMVIGATSTPASDGVQIKRATAAQTTVSDADFAVGTPACTSGCTYKKVSGVPTAFRFGRLRLFNAFGSEKANLELPVQAQYWSGKSWVLNDGDNCTSLPANAFALSGGIWDKTSVSSAVTLTGGKGSLVLTKPNPVTTGFVDVAANLGISGNDQSCLSSHGGAAASLPWLRSQNGGCATTYDRDPSARGSFGMFSPEMRKTVHVRELF